MSTDNITCHLREDRRHVQDSDVKGLKETINIPLNFEMAMTAEMLQVARTIQPHAITLVPEKRQELTTEGGLDVKQRPEELRRYIESLKATGALVSLFVDHNKDTILRCRDLGVGAIEIHTGDFCKEMMHAKTTSEQWKLVDPYIQASQFAHEQGLQVHFGHGLNYNNAHWLQEIPHCEEANIGHAVIARAVFVGLVEAVKEMKSLINDSKFQPSVRS